MLFLPTAWTYETGLPPEIGILGFWDSIAPVSCRVRGTGFSRRVLYKHLRQHRWARGAKVWVEAMDKAHRPGLWGPKGVSMPLCQRLSMQISQICRVRFIPTFVL